MEILSSKDFFELLAIVSGICLFLLFIYLAYKNCAKEKT